MFYRHGKQPQGRNAIDISLKNAVELGLVNRGMIYKKDGSSSEERTVVCCLFIHVKKLFYSLKHVTTLDLISVYELCVYLSPVVVRYKYANSHIYKCVWIAYLSTLAVATMLNNYFHSF